MKNMAEILRGNKEYTVLPTHEDMIAVTLLMQAGFPMEIFTDLVQAWVNGTFSHHLVEPGEEE